jgi:hypothetical protein
MPTPDYSKSCIYMLRHKDDTELENIYIGSTTNFRGRKCNHLKACCNPNNRDYNHKKYQYIRANGGWEEWIMVWLEDYPCKSKRELELKEDEVMLKYQNRLNDKRASRTRQQYTIDNKEIKKETDKIRYENNKDKILEERKEYRKKNNEIIKERDREWYEKNKDRIAEKKNEKIECNICGFKVNKSNIKVHQRTKKCQSNL